jgi:predicted dehydrogenase
MIAASAVKEARKCELAVVGCGAVVDGPYRDALRKAESRGIARVVALIDPNPARTAALKRHFTSARTFADLSDALASVTPDLTIVASPPVRHADHATAALRAGSHVLCEKPMATSVVDAERMLEAARVAKRVLVLGMVRRIFPSLADARALLAAGALGDDVRFVFREGRVYDWPVSSDAVFRRSAAGGGVLTDVGSHVLDYLAALFGTPEVSAYADDGQTDGVETNCRIDLAFPGARGVVQLSWSQPLAAGLHIVGSAAELMLYPGGVDVLRLRRHGEAWQTRVSDATWPADLRETGELGTPRSMYDCFYFQLVQALRAVVHGERVPATGENGLAAVRTLDECYQRATPLTLPWLPAAEQAQATARHWRRARWVAA